MKCTCFDGVRQITVTEIEMAEQEDIDVEYIHDFMDTWMQVASKIVTEKRSRKIDN